MFSPSSHPQQQLLSCLARDLQHYSELFASHYLIYLLKADRGKGRQNLLKAFEFYLDLDRLFKLAQSQTVPLITIRSAEGVEAVLG